MKYLNSLLVAGVVCALLYTPQVGAQAPAEPSVEHEMLAKDVGAWDCEMRMWMAGPDSEPMVTKGSEVNEMFGKFWLVSKFKADFGGQDFEGRASLGYDPSKKKYVGTWFDTMNPAMSLMEGSYDKATKTMTMMTTGVGPDGKPMAGKNTTEYKEDGTRLFTMYNQDKETKEFSKMMEIVYKKR